MSKKLENFTRCDIFTPDIISKQMSEKLHNTGNILDPCVGTGNLLKFINFDNYNEIDVYELKLNYLNTINNDKINKFNKDFLKDNISKKYKNIILNPPYIKIQDLTTEYREYIKNNYEIIDSGNIDIYYAFLLKCLNLLEDDGIMISITPNSYLYTKSAYKLRKYLIENNYIKEIIDFGYKKVFKEASVYCCITIFSKIKKNTIIYNNIEIPIKNISKNDYFITVNNLSSNVTNKLLKDVCKISNGIATLRDNIYIHKNKLYDEPCWKEIINRKEIKYIIFPYNDGKIINEEEFKEQNPLTYDYLLLNKDELAKRDNGNKKYPKWYSFGRTQSIIISKKEKVIYIPSFIDPNKNDYLTIGTPKLYYSSLCIEPYNINDIDNISNSIKKNIKFLESISSKRAHGWINISSSNLYKIPFITS